jgi:DNA-binding IscR family transcriptional regulator
MLGLREILADTMKNDQRLWRTLHVLIHMNQHQTPLTSQAIGQMLNTHPVVVRRTLAGLRKQNLIQAEKGHGGGWKLLLPLEQISLREVYAALGEPPLWVLSPVTEPRGCLVEKAVNQALDEVLQQARDWVLERFSHLTVAQIERDFQALLPFSERHCTGSHDNPST